MSCNAPSYYGTNHRCASADAQCGDVCCQHCLCNDNEETVERDYERPIRVRHKYKENANDPVERLALDCC